MTLSARSTNAPLAIRLGAFFALLILQLAPLTASAVPGDVLSELKISDTAGGFAGTLSDSDSFGGAVAALGDLDGDGVDDLAVGSPLDDDGGSNSGAVWILFLNPDGTVKDEQKISRTSGGFGGSLSDSESFGSSLAPLGDLDGDGVVDLAVSAPRGSAVLPGTEEGAFFVLFLNVDGTVKDEQRIDAVTGGFDGSLFPADHFGQGLSAIGDLDQDGTTELAVGVPGDDAGAADTGAVWILYLLPDGTVHHEQKISDTAGNFGIGLSPADAFGSSTAGLGDLDGDGIPDIAVGASEDDDSGSGAGAVWTLFLNENGTVKSTTKITGFASDNFDRFGGALGLPGDLNGDGLPELAVGATGDDDGGFNKGAVYVLSLDSAGAATQLQKISDTSGGLSEIIASVDSFGSSIAGIANFDGLGGGGLLVGAPQDDDGGVSGTTNRGAVYLLEIEGSSLICGNAVLDPVEECDDGNTADFDGCTATCEVEDTLAIFGIAETAGVLTVEIDGAMVNIGVSSGDNPSTLAPLIATLINVTPSLAALGTNAQSLNGVAYSNGTFASGLFSGLGISALVNPGRVLGFQKISDTQGGFTGVLDNLDRFGTSVASLGDLDGDGIGDLAVGVELDDEGGDARGAVWVLFLNSDGTVKGHQKISDTQGGFTGTLSDFDLFGASVASLGDLDGDGVGDLAVGAIGDDDGGTSHGAVWVLFLNSDGSVKSHQKISDTQGGFTGILGTEDFFGFSVASLGDFDGDGIGDLAAGAADDDGDDPNHGAVWILFLNSDGTVKSHQKISDTQGGFTGILDFFDFFGSSVASLGDLDGDGVGDLAVGAFNDDDGGHRRGAVWVLFLNSNGSVKSHQKISDTQGGFTGVLVDDDVFGASIASLGDLDGDGAGDLAVGAFDDDDGGSPRGAVWVLLMNSDGSVKSHQKISDTQGGFTGVLVDDDVFGASIASLGDLDGDGIGELAVGADRDDDGNTDRGAVYILSLDSAAPPVCGDLQIRLPETCDDGNTSSGDGCYQTCQVEDEVELNGVAQGGTIVAEVSGTILLIVTSAGQDAATVASNLAGAINLTPALQMQGISSVALFNRIVSDGTFDNVTSNDPGIFVPEPGLLVMLTAGIFGLTVLSNRRQAQRKSAGKTSPRRSTFASDATAKENPE